MGFWFNSPYAIKEGNPASAGPVRLSSVQPIRCDSATYIRLHQQGGCVFTWVIPHFGINFHQHFAGDEESMEEAAALGVNILWRRMQAIALSSRPRMFGEKRIDALLHVRMALGAEWDDTARRMVEALPDRSTG
ncbi:hypothetical protein [Nonomuraea sp. NPDC049504]|uniref:hypothetical protein n=1 Tax=Nonomuraea sp. NPDC049504 TaxID=3154729 RepID=UPI0034295FBB